MAASLLARGQCSVLRGQERALAHARPAIALPVKPAPAIVVQHHRNFVSSSLAPSRLFLVPRSAAAAGAAGPATSDFQVGHVYDATVKEAQAKGMVVTLGSVDVFLSKSQVSKGANAQTDLTTLFTAGEAVKVLVTGVNPIEQKPYVSIKALEATPGQVLTDKPAVWAGAEKAAEKFRIEGAEKKAKRQKFLDSLKEGQELEGIFVSAIQGKKAVFLVNNEFNISLSYKDAKCNRLGFGSKAKLVVAGRLSSGYPRLERVLEKKPATDAAAQA